MFATELVCSNCGERYPVGPLFLGCSSCRNGGVAGALEVDYDYDLAGVAFKKAIGSTGTERERMWRFRALLPVSDPKDVVTLGEGATPLFRVAEGGENPLTNLFVKNEAANPSGAFKDRFHSVSISMAAQMGFAKAVASSTGNHGLSLAAYGRAAGMATTVFVDPRAPLLQRQAMQMLGASVIVKRDRRASLADFVVEHGWYPSTYMTPMPVSTPYGMEGYKAMAYETMLDLGKPPDHFFVPTAAGDGFYGPWKGFRELRQLGLSDSVPHMHAVQALGANWLANTVRSRADHALVDADADSLALSIADPTGGYMCVRAVEESNGSVVELSEIEIQTATTFLASRGLIVETASAAAVAAAWKLFEQGRVDRDASCVCVLTGAGLKWPETVSLMAGGAQEVVDPTDEELLLEATRLAPSMAGRSA